MKPSKVTIAESYALPTRSRQSSLEDALEETTSPIQSNALREQYERGVELCKQHRYTEAIESLDGAIALNSSYANAYYNKGLALKALGQYEDAMIEFNQAISLKPDNILYLCSKGKLFILQDDSQRALDCFNEAYSLSKDASLNVTFSQSNIDFIQKTLNTRTELLEKITRVEASAIESQKIIDTFSNPEHPAFHQAVEHFLSLKQAKSKLIEQCLESCSATTDLVDTEQLSPSYDSDKADKQTTAKIFRTLYHKNHSLSLQLQQLEEKLSTQKEEFSKILEDLSAEQGDIRISIDQHEIIIEEHTLSINRLNKFAEKLELDQEGINKLIHDLKEKGFHNLNATLTHFSSLKDNLTSMSPEPQMDEDNVYQINFFHTLKRDLIAAQSAAMLVTSTNIIRNGKTGEIGRVGDLLEIAGEIIPTFGGCIQFLGAILNTIDHSQQQKTVERLANIADGPMEMHHIASSVAKILSQDYLDKSLIDNRPTSLKSRVVGYLQSFLEELSDNSSSSHSGTRDTGTSHSSSKMMFIPSMFKKEKSSAHKDEESTPPNKSFGFSFWGKKTVPKATDADSSSLDFLTEEKEGKSDAHLVSSIILTAIYKGDIQARFGQHQTIIQKMLEAVFSKLELDITLIPQILEKELTTTLIVDAVIVTPPASEPISPEKQIAEDIAQNILDEIKKQVSVPETFDSTFMHSMATRLETTYSQTKTPLIKSLIESYKFKTAFIGQVIELLVAKLGENNTTKPSLSFIRDILKETEQALREEDDSFPTTQNANEILVWCCDIVYNNPLLNDRKLMEEVTKTINATDLDKLLNIGLDDPEAAETLMQNVQIYGIESVMNIIFGNESQKYDDVKDESHGIGDSHQEETL